MISVIVPVYNVEPYVRKCLDSVINQTYRDLEILVIDDGSTDGSGKICDEYAGKDERIKIFHTENRGLSAARNLGLDEAQGEWIGFVDSDDWIEPDMYEVLLKRAEESEADVVECGVYKEYSDRTVERKREECQYSGTEAVNLLLQCKLSNAVWNKLWKNDCFSSIRFPEGRVFEEYATTYRLFLDANYISTVAESEYHYFKRKGSLSTSYNADNLSGYWISHKERYDALINQVDEESRDKLVWYLALAASRTWAHLYDCEKADRAKINDELQEMNTFTKQHIPLFGKRDWKLSRRIGVFFPHFMNPGSFYLAWIGNTVFRKIIPVIRHRFT